MEQRVFCLSPDWEAFITQNSLVTITYQLHPQKTVALNGYIKECFQRKKQWLIILETGLAIPLPQIKSIVLSSR